MFIGSIEPITKDSTGSTPKGSDNYGDALISTDKHFYLARESTDNRFHPIISLRIRRRCQWHPSPETTVNAALAAASFDDMSCIGGNRLLTPLLPRSKPPPLASTSPLSLASFTSTHLLRLRRRYSALILSTSSTVSASLRTLAFSRFGGFIDDEEEEEEEEEEEDEEEFDLWDDEDGGASSSVRKEIDLSMIKGQNVRLIDQNQKMVGIVSKIVAKQKAQDAGLNLVIVQLDADPPVVKIVDYDKYRYEKQRKKKEQQKKTGSKATVKELKMGCKIDVHDYNVRLRAAQKFLRSGHKVKITVNIKGHEEDYMDLAIELLQRFLDDIGELAVQETENLVERNAHMVLAPSKLAAASRNEPPKRKGKLREKNVSAGI
ncbi:Translation initiation factor IF3-2, chloroplastic-like protein [Drosera capensis]